MITVHRLRLALSALALSCASAVLAGPQVPVHTVRTDLKPLIRAAFDRSAQFAVPVPYAVALSDGRWSVAGGTAQWHYALTVPGAVSLSFHADVLTLPAGATLVVQSARTTAAYRAGNVHRGELWSRVQPGDALSFTLSVPAAERAQVRMHVASLQAGYRSLGPGVANHPYYLKLRQQATSATGTAACIVNYECKVSAGNTPPAAATVALIIENQYECTGTLINDVPGDNTPYILSARHCISGQVGVVDDPGAAAGTTVYWDATSPCNSTLASIYDTTLPTQTGAQTLVEQQDAWLIRLDAGPVVADAQFAGFDASGATVQGGYTIHHAEGYDKQYVAWFGQPALANRFAGFSDFLDTVNQTGNIGPGASGSALFDQNNRIAGSLTYGRQSGDPSDYGACPINPPPTPNGNNGVADFTALAAVWNSTSDATSSTGNATIKSFLDPHDTGTVIVNSAPAAVISFSASTQTLTEGQPLELTWSASGASSCSAGGGASGDGWSGSLAPAGSQSLTENNIASISYGITCTYGGGRTAQSSVSVNWVGPTPLLTLTASAPALWITRPEVLTWTSNVAPCALNGGSLALTNLAGSGSTTTTQAASADVIYTLTCGPPGDVGSAATLVQYSAPSVTFEANGTDRLLGQPLVLEWQTAADTCTPTGGAPNDGWSANSFSGTQVNSFSPQVSSTGTYTYTLTCTSGSLSAQQSVSVTVESNAAYVTSALGPTSVAFTGSPADYVTYSWNSNLTQCRLATSAALAPIDTNPLPDQSFSGLFPQDSETLNPARSGVFTLSETCTDLSGALTASSAPLTLTVTPPPPVAITLSFTPATVVYGENFSIAWSALNASSCSSGGGMPGDTWSVGAATQTAGSITETAQAGSYVFTLTCASVDPASPPGAVSKPLTVEVLGATLTASATALTSGASFTLTWSSTGAQSCAASGGGANGSPWSGTLATSGSVTQTASTAGTFTYTLNCTAGGEVATQTVTIKVAAASSGGGGGGGGGGALSLLELALGLCGIGWTLRARLRFAAVDVTAAAHCR